MSPNPVDPKLVGDAWPSAMPAEDPALYGHVEMQPEGAFEVRSLQTFRLVYTVGRYGIDDTGGIRVVFRSTNEERFQIRIDFAKHECDRGAHPGWLRVDQGRNRR